MKTANCQRLYAESRSSVICRPNVMIFGSRVVHIMNFYYSTTSAGFHGNVVMEMMEINWNENKDMLLKMVEMLVFYSLCLKIFIIIICPWPWVKVIQTDMVCNLMPCVICMQSLEMPIFSSLSAFKWKIWPWPWIKVVQTALPYLLQYWTIHITRR